jgi:hypothetical protein
MSYHATDHWHVTILLHLISNLHGNGFHSSKVIWGCNWEARLDDVDPELSELPGYVQFLLACEVGTRGLLPITKRGVEDANVVGV